MKKIFKMLIVLFIMYIGVQVAFNFFSKGYEYEYEVTTNDIEYKIKEKTVKNIDSELDSYYFEIQLGENKFYYQTLNNFKNSTKVIDNIYSYSNENYSCILPVFKNNTILTDIMCMKGNIITTYHDLINIDYGVDEFAQSLSDIGYNTNLWLDDSDKKQSYDIFTYSNNIAKDDYIALSNYKGLYIINKAGAEDINLFTNDNYKPTIAVTIGKFFVIADYNAKYRFNKFLLVDLTTGRTSEIPCSNNISFDSYIQGVYGDSFYIFDKDAKVQYEVNVSKKSILEVGNENTGIKIYNGKELERISAADAKNKDIMFNQQEINKEGYDKVYKLGGEKTGFYYMYKREGSKYHVYRANVQNDSQITYLFDTTDIDRIIYKNNNIYYIYNNTINYFNDSFGVKKLVEYNELKFNQDLYFSIYTK